jgi:hypothetical protein
VCYLPPTSIMLHWITAPKTSGSWKPPFRSGSDS